MLCIDGSQGEGGGQILRSSLTLSMVTGTPFRIENIRARRRRPGLLRQHLTAVQAAAEICGGTVDGADMRSAALEFSPGSVRPGDYAFAVGTAGSSSLVLQTVLPVLALADAPSTVQVRGGTHNPMAPPFEFLQRALFPLVQRMGPRVEGTLHRPGYYPAGGGHATFRIEPAARLTPLVLLERGAVVRQEIVAIVAMLPFAIGEREVGAAADVLGWDPALGRVQVVDNAVGPGNAVIIDVQCEALTEVFVGFGEKGVSAERVAQGAAREAADYLRASAPVGQHLADQLMLWMALAGEGAFRTVALTEHARTQRAVIRAFLGRDLTWTERAADDWQVQL